MEVMSVSYTHLDVYKRQVRPDVIVIKENSKKNLHIQSHLSYSF